MPNKLPKFFDKHKICIICEGNEEYEYLKALNNPKVTIFFQEDKKEYIIYKGERFEIDRSLWNMDIFAEVFFS